MPSYQAITHQDTHLWRPVPVVQSSVQLSVPNSISSPHANAMFPIPDLRLGVSQPLSLRHPPVHLIS